MKHNECRNLFVDALYGDISSDRRKAFEAHLHECNDCMSAFAMLKKTASLMSRRQRVEPSVEQWKIFWTELSRRIARGEPYKAYSRPWWKGLSEFLQYRPAIGYAGAAVALVVAGIFIGRTYFAQYDFDAGRLSRQLSATEKTILNDRALNYLEKSKVLLLGIVNTGTVTPSSFEMSKRQEISRELVREAAPLKSDLTEADQQRMKKLIGDLEMILIQIANLEAEKDFPALDMVKSGVDRKGILLKINLEQMRLHEEQQITRPVTEPSSQESS